MKAILIFRLQKYGKSKGAKMGLTTKVGIARLGVDEALVLPRLDCNDFPPKSYNYQSIV